MYLAIGLVVSVALRHPGHKLFKHFLYISFELYAGVLTRLFRILEYI